MNSHYTPTSVRTVVTVAVAEYITVESDIIEKRKNKFSSGNHMMAAAKSRDKPRDMYNLQSQVT